MDARAVAGIYRRNIDLVTTANEGFLGASDERQLAHAITLGRVVVTSDQDFLRLAQAHVETASFFPGVIFILPATPVGEAVRAIVLVALILDAADMVNRIEWVP